MTRKGSMQQRLVGSSARVARCTSPIAFQNNRLRLLPPKTRCPPGGHHGLTWLTCSRAPTSRFRGGTQGGAAGFRAGGAAGRGAGSCRRLGQDACRNTTNSSSSPRVDLQTGKTTPRTTLTLHKQTASPLRLPLGGGVCAAARYQSHRPHPRRGLRGQCWGHDNCLDPDARWSSLQCESGSINVHRRNERKVAWLKY